MARLGPLPPRPKVVVGVSGGADSMALAVLSRDWVWSVGGEIRAIVVDHGLRQAAGLEALVTRTRLARLGIPATLLRLRTLSDGHAVEARARAARHALLEAACADAGGIVLLLGHQALDQAETLLLRTSSGSGTAGLAAMAGRRATTKVILLRPLITVSPLSLRATLREKGIGWIEDLSNKTPASRRSRLRSAAGDSAGIGCGILGLVAASAHYADGRARCEEARNRALAATVAFYPEGFAKILPGPLPAAALASLVRALSGRNFAPSAAQLDTFARHPRPATLGGVRFIAAGRLGPGILAIREARAMAPPIPAIPGACWDGRFRLGNSARPPNGATLGPVGSAGALLRSRSNLPAAVLVTLPALRLGEKLVAVPHVGYPDEECCRKVPVLFSPREPAGGVSFVTEQRGGDAERPR